MDFESVQELCQHLLLCLAPLFDLRVHFSIVNALQVTNVDSARAVSIKLCEGSQDEVLPKLVKIRGNCPHQLFKINFSTLVRIEQIEEFSALLLTNIQPEVTKSLPELLDVKLSITTVIHDLENTLHAEDAASTSLCKHLFEHLHQLVITVLNALVGCIRSPIDLLGPGHPRVARSGAGHV